MTDTIDVEIAGEAFKVDVSRNVEYFTNNWRAVESGEDEPQLYAFISEHADPDGIFFDVGSFQGSAALLASRKYAVVFAFEADPVSAEALRDNIAANEADNITVVQKFFGDEKGTQAFYSIDYGNNSGSSAFHTEGKTRWDVETIRIDEFILEEGLETAPIYMKIDIEGAEYLSIDALRKTIEKYDVRCVCLSLHPMLLANQIKGQSIVAKIRRRILVLSRTLRLLAAFGKFDTLVDAQGKRASRSRLVRDIITTGRHRVSDSEVYLT